MRIIVLKEMENISKYSGWKKRNKTIVFCGGYDSLHRKAWVACRGTLRTNKWLVQSLRIHN